jgi:hypothetical protein
MEQSGGEFRIDVRITPERAAEFLRLLAEDPAFRRDFESRTQDLLREWDIDVPAEALPERVFAPTEGLLVDTYRQLVQEGEEYGEEMHPPPFFPPFTRQSMPFWIIFIVLTRARRTS